MALSINTVTYSGGPQTFQLSFAAGYLNESDITVQVVGEVDGAGDPINRAFTFNSTNEILVTDPIPTGSQVRLVRTVQKTALTVDFRQEGAITREALDRNARHVLMAVHEALDGRIDGSTQTLETVLEDAQAAAAAAAASATEASTYGGFRVDLFSDVATVTNVPVNGYLWVTSIDTVMQRVQSSGDAHFTYINDGNNFFWRVVRRSGVYNLSDFGGLLAQEIGPLAGDNERFGPYRISSTADPLFLLIGESPVTDNISLSGLSAHATTHNGVSIGSRASTTAAYNEQIARAGVNVRDVNVNNIGLLTGSSYAIALTAIHSSITDFSLRNTNRPTTGDWEALYTKLRDGLVWGGLIQDSGQDAISIKGTNRGDTSGPQGYGNLFGGINITASATFNASEGGIDKKGIRVECGGNTLFAMRAFGLNSDAMYTTNESANGWVAGMVDFRSCGETGRGAIRVRHFGDSYFVKSAHVRDTSGTGVEVEGQTSLTRVVMENVDQLGITGAAYDVQPTTGGVLRFEIAGGSSRDIGGDFLNLAEAAAGRIIVDSHRIDDFTGELIDTSSAAIPSAMEWRNSPWQVRTTSAVTLTAGSFPIATNAVQAFTLTVTGISGTDVLRQTIEAVYNNTGSGAVLVGQNVGTEIRSAGAAGWAIALDGTVGGNMRVRVTGVASTTIDWFVDINLIMQ